MIASILAVAAAAAAATAGTADATAEWQACFGPAAVSAGFDDVSMGGAHYKNIQCLAYYGITTGRMGGAEFDPFSNVTRSQMALFLARAADAAGLELGDVMAHEFADIADMDAERVNAISRLTEKGIMTTPSDTSFDPHGIVSRADMAEYLVALVALAGAHGLERNKDTLLYTFNDNVISGDDAGEDREGHDEENDFFTDVYAMASAPTVNAIYTAFELGITTGYQDSTFKPNRAVTRQGMASFLMRAMAHTNLRPAGLSGQRAGTEAAGWDIQISLRGADFAPVTNTAVDVFYSNWPDSAFDDDGMCVTHPVNRVRDVAPSTNPCEVDIADMLTDADGNAVYDIGTGTVGTVDEGDAISVTCSAAKTDGGTAGNYTIQSSTEAIKASTTVYTWTAAVGTELDDSATLVVVPVTSSVRPDRPKSVDVDYAVVTGGLDAMKNQDKAHFGSTVEWTLQLRGLTDHDNDADTPEVPVDTGPDKSGNKYDLVDARTRGGTSFYTVPSQVVPNEDGSATISVTQADANGAAQASDNDDVVVMLTLTPAADNTAGTGDGITPQTTGAFHEGGAAAVDSPLTLKVTFSDDDPAAGAHLITGESRNTWQRVPRAGSRGGNAVTITVIDEYGDPVRGFKVGLGTDKATGTPPDSVIHAGLFTTGRNGQSTIGYSYGGAAATTETLTVRVAGSDGTPEDTSDPTVTATMHWAGTGQLTTDSAVPVLVADADENLFVINSTETYAGNPGSAAPHVYSYDSIDTFNIQSEQVSMEQFEAAINDEKVGVVSLTWSGYQPSRPVDRSLWTINITCDASA